MQITTIGLDIAKNVFQVHGIDAAEKVVVRKQLRRGQVMKFFAALPPCLVGMEACATARYWARELTKLGHEVRLMPAKDVKAYVKRNKNDAADAEAIWRIWLSSGLCRDGGFVSTTNNRTLIVKCKGQGPSPGQVTADATPRPK